MSAIKSRTADDQAQRANPPGRYVCPNCGETLSGPARAYTCPGPLPVAKERKA